MKLDSRYAEYFPEYSGYFGRALMLLKSMHVMTNYGKLFADDLTEYLIEAVFIQFQYQMFIYYKHAQKMEQKLLFYLMLMIVSIGILLKLLENYLWTL